jgi:hypothetical protein
MHHFNKIPHNLSIARVTPLFDGVIVPITSPGEKFGMCSFQFPSQAENIQEGQKWHDVNLD